MRLILVIRHAVAMYRALKLPKNRNKGDWNQMDIYLLHSLLLREVAELQTEIWRFVKNETTAARVQEEAADVSNFAAMIADVAKRQG